VASFHINGYFSHKFHVGLAASKAQISLGVAIFLLCLDGMFGETTCFPGKTVENKLKLLTVSLELFARSVF